MILDNELAVGDKWRLEYPKSTPPKKRYKLGKIVDIEVDGEKVGEFEVKYTDDLFVEGIVTKVITDKEDEE